MLKELDVEELNKQHDIISYYGLEHQMIKTMEELAELITAIAKGDWAAIVEEMADVENMIAQLKIAKSIDTDAPRMKKIDRTIERIKEEIKVNGEGR